MRRSGAPLQWGAASALALLIAVGVLTVGVPASSSHPTKAASPYRLVQLTVVNKSPWREVLVSVCDGRHYSSARNCPEFNNYPLAAGKSAHRSSNEVSGFVSYSIRGPGWHHAYEFYFTAQNPIAAQPFIRMTPRNESGRELTHRLSEGQTLGPFDVEGFTVTVHRGADTPRVKDLTITITKVPPD